MADALRVWAYARYWQWSMPIRASCKQRRHGDRGRRYPGWARPVDHTASSVLQTQASGLPDCTGVTAAGAHPAREIAPAPWGAAFVSPRTKRNAWIDAVPGTMRCATLRSRSGGKSPASEPLRRLIHCRRCAARGGRRAAEDVLDAIRYHPAEAPTGTAPAARSRPTIGPGRKFCGRSRVPREPGAAQLRRRLPPRRPLPPRMVGARGQSHFPRDRRALE